MFLRNRLLLFFVGILIANTCFGDGATVTTRGTGVTNWSGFSMNLKPISFTTACNCDANYYVAKCGNIDLDVGTIVSYVKNALGTDTLCWDDSESYTDMHYLLHLNSNTNLNYVGDGNIFADADNTWVQNACTESDMLQKVRKEIYKACLTSCTCYRCPNGGITENKTLTDDETNPTYFKDFNTIADCFNVGGSDAKGTFTLTNPWSPTNKTGDKCYYNYYSE